MRGAGRAGLRRTSTVYVAGSLAAKGARFLLIPLYVHQLSRGEVGTLIFLEAIAVALSRALTLGFGQAVKRFYAEHDTEDEADNFVASLWWLGCGVAVAVGIVLVIVALDYGQHLTRQIPSHYLALAIVSGVLRSNLGMALERFIVREEPYRHGLFNICHLATTAGFTIIAVLVFRMGVAGALWADVAALTLWNIITAGIVSRGRWPRFQWPAMRNAIRYSLPAVPHGMFTWAITFSDRLILERFVSLSAVGVYGIGYQFASLLPVFSLAFVNAWIPRFFRGAGDDEGPAQFARVFVAQLAAILAVALPVIAFAPEAIRLVTKPEYEGAIPILRVVAIGLVFHGTYQALLLPLFYRSRTGWVSGATGVALATNLTLNLLLIPRVGIMGAAVATLAAYLVTTVFVGRLVARHYPVPVDWTRMSVLIALAVSSAGLAVLLDSELLVPALAAKTLALALFFVPLAFVPGLLAQGEPAFLSKVIMRRSTRDRSAAAAASCEV